MNWGLCEKTLQLLKINSANLIARLLLPNTTTGFPNPRYVSQNSFSVSRYELLTTVANFQPATVIVDSYLGNEKESREGIAGLVIPKIVWIEIALKFRQDLSFLEIEKSVKQVTFDS